MATGPTGPCWRSFCSRLPSDASTKRRATIAPGMLRRRVEAGLYDRLAGNGDDDPQPALDMGDGPAAKPLPAHPTPQPRNRP